MACFDTTFHATLPPAARTYAVPREWNQRWGLRRYGFHGLSHAYAVRRGAELVGRPPEELRIVSCHLGAGASLAAVRGGRSVDTTMGFTPLAGLVMNTRPGHARPRAAAVAAAARPGAGRRARPTSWSTSPGSKGLSGTSGDLRDVLAGRAAGDADAALAFDVYVHRLCREIGAMTAATGGLDVLVMTGGMGEHSAEVRGRWRAALATSGRRWTRAEPATTGDAEISAPGAAVRTVVVTAREDLEIRRQVLEVLGRS